MNLTPEKKDSTALESLFKELEIAKANVITLVKNPDSSIDFHGLAYWAGRVESLRETLRASL